MLTPQYKNNDMTMKTILQPGHTKGESLAVLQAMLPFLEEWWTDKFEVLETKIKTMDEIKKNQDTHDKNIWELNRNVNDLGKIIETLQTDMKEKHSNLETQLDDLKDNISKIGLAHFLKHNWWKLGGILGMLGTVMGVVADQLYHIAH